ncbi:hypothetical protein F5B17DRAFT_406249 [Nemania serpens]|nr:hypothetical protein F5B17DRAFT_406249 [Nemania serpens]
MALYATITQHESKWPTLTRSSSRVLQTAGTRQPRIRWPPSISCRPMVSYSISSNHNLDAAEITNFHQLPINDFTFKDHLASTQPPNLLQPPNGGSRLNMNPATTEIPDEGPTEKELGKLKTPERLEEQRPRKKNKRAVEPVQANKDRSPLVALEQPCGQPDKGPKHQPSPTTSAAPQVSESTLGGTVDEGADVYGSNFLDPSCARICER